MRPIREPKFNDYKLVKSSEDELFKFAPKSIAPNVVINFEKPTGLRIMDYSKVSDLDPLFEEIRPNPKASKQNSA